MPSMMKQTSALAAVLLLLSIQTVVAEDGENATDECDAVIDTSEYDEGLHIGAIFIMLITSFIGGSLPLIAQRLSVSMDNDMLLCAKMFGAGVILATGLIHMLVPAAESLTDPCLPVAFTEDYTAYYALFVLIAILFVQLIHLGASSAIRRHARAHEGDKSTSQFTVDIEETASGPSKSRINKHAHHFATTLVLELGIATHSIIIGVTLGVTSEEFKTLLIALVFHQFFEGISLATVILECNWRSKWIPVMMVVIYSLTTPLGIAIGIGIHTTYQESSTTVLLTTGILDALCAGILLHNSLVDIIHTHFESTTFKSASTLRQFFQIASLWTGAGIMSFIGKYA